jgi:hypothetical protein
MKLRTILWWALLSIGTVAVSFSVTLKLMDWFEERSDVQRASDLVKLNTAIAAYRDENGSYPHSVNDNWTGRRNAWGPSTEIWIPGLASTYISKFPRDPRNNDDGTQQYLYKSNGKDFKLISHFPDDCETVKSKRPSMIDPARSPCNAYGFWSAGATTW